MKEKIEETIRHNQLNHRVFLMGEIAGSDKNSFYA